VRDEDGGVDRVWTLELGTNQPSLDASPITRLGMSIGDGEVS